MRTHSNYKVLLTVLLSYISAAHFAAGCGNPNRIANAGNPGAPQHPAYGDPCDSAERECRRLSRQRHYHRVTFSKAMNPATINTSTFTLTGPGGASVAGTVTYVAATKIATFTPSISLASNTIFTATITTGAADTFGNTLAANVVWTFTTSVGPCAALLPPPPLPGAHH